MNAARTKQVKKRIELLKERMKRPWDPVLALFDYQRSIVNDPAPNRAVEGTRQFGKSRVAAVEIVKAGIENPGSDCAYVDMDIEHGGKVVWTEIAKLLDDFRIPARIIDNELRFTNGSTGYIFNGQPAQLKKLQGLKYAILIIDEVQEAHALLDILTMCKPALMRYNGRVLLLGIPGRAKGIGPWWEITHGKLSHTYSFHRGSFRDNTALAEEAKERLFNEEKDRLGEKSGDFLRHWCGVWPERDYALLVYHYDPNKNGYDPSQLPAPECRFHSLGMDPGGVRDSEAFEVIGHGNKDGQIWHLDECVTARGEAGSWNDSGDRAGPLVERWRPNKRFYDYGSAHKDAQTLIYKSDQHIVFDAVPSKDPYLESKRINSLLETGRLWIRRGSKLESDLLYTMWDADSLGKATPKYAGSYKQDAADALRCAMWGVDGWMSVQQEKKKLSDAEREAEAIRELLKPKKTYGPGETKYGNGVTSRFGARGAYGPRQR